MSCNFRAFYVACVFVLYSFLLNLKLFFGFIFSDIMCLSMDPHIKMLDFVDEMREIFKFGEEQNFTMKWLDEEGKQGVVSNLTINFLLSGIFSLQ